MREIYFHGGRPVQHLIKRVQDINQQLLKWEESVPAELKLKSFTSLEQNEPLDPHARIFQLQALALQLSYDNIQLILHRPLLVYNGVLSLGPHVRRPQPPDLSTDFWESSKEQCWTSARRISSVDEYPGILRLARNFHVAGHVGIQTFTAGVMLGIFALSKPFSAQAQEAKRSIGRLIKKPKLLGYRTTMSDQTGRILERLLRLILDEELKMLTSDELALHVPVQSNKGRHVQDATMPAARTSSGANQTLPTSDNAKPLHTGPSDHEAFYYGIVANEGLPNNAPLRDQDESPVVEMASVGAGSSTEQLAFHGAIPSGQDEGHSNIVVDETLFNPSLGNSFFDSDFLGELDDLGQGWMWEDCYQFS